jgi:hypothetical protein
MIFVRDRMLGDGVVREWLRITTRLAAAPTPTAAAPAPPPSATFPFPVFTVDFTFQFDRRECGAFVWFVL